MLLTLCVGCFRWDSPPDNVDVRLSVINVDDDVRSLQLNVVQGTVTTYSMNGVVGGENEGISTYDFILGVNVCDVDTPSAVPSVYYLNAGLKSMRISADKTLFGQPTGQQLEGYFKIAEAYNVQMRWPSYEPIDEGDAQSLTSVSNWCNGVVRFVQCRDFWIQFAEVPAEKYDEITFTVAMDILLPDGGERTLTGSVKVVFE